jgi:hypothetical protein
MKTLVKKIVRKLARLPGIGRLVRIAAAVYRLPEIREDVLALVSGHYAHGAGQAPAAQPALWRSLAELRENTAGDANLVRSVPVALRRLTREMHALRRQMDGAGSGTQAAAAERQDDALPLARDAAGAVRVAYQLETFTQDALRRQVLPQLYASLEAGGQLQVLAADAGAALAAYAAGSCGYEELRAILYGAPERDGRLQLNMFTRESLSALLREAGFDVAQGTQASGERPYSIEILANKPLPHAARH